MSENYGFMYTFGDIVKVAGDDRKYVVDSFRKEVTYYIDDSFEDKIYELTCVSNGTFTEVEEEFIIEKVGTYDEDADDWDDWDDDESGEIYYTIQLNENGEAKVVGNEKKLTPREESSREAARLKQERKEKAAQIDVLLDELNDYRALFEKFGDQEYAEKIAHIMAKLTELTE